MTDEEIAKARAKATAEVILGTKYLRFLAKFKAKPQLIRVSTEIMAVLVSSVEIKSVTYFGVPVILDDQLSVGGCVCQWKI